jgi:hypothetical protein
MAQLRSLGVQLVSSLNLFDVTLEGNGWYDYEDGSDISKQVIMRYFDARYVAALAKAAPNLEELELIGLSNGDIVCQITYFHLAHLNSTI